eukprot:CAMPEP_0172698504 /NCGR_PEP_ID=MMETSP1074-20121228/29522_1 /TAXON_ID=2916 /ORGANISM="Ceratium fusus, Strain PA161109" /LENGTH=286 /DNA_ID=CAMNT_0013519555 /DNA_START=78 /DNA_END=938 /DNA_ORIENTATION=+
MWCLLMFCLVCAVVGQKPRKSDSCWTPGGCGVAAGVIGDEILTDTKLVCVRYCKKLEAAFAQHGSYGRPRSCLCRPANCSENRISSNKHPGIMLSTAQACLGTIQPPCETPGGCAGSSIGTEIHMRSKLACALHCQKNRSSLAQYGSWENPHSCICKSADCLEKPLPGSKHLGAVLSTSHQCLGNAIAPPCWGVNQLKCLEADVVQEGKDMQGMMISAFDVQTHFTHAPWQFPIFIAAAISLTLLATLALAIRRRTWEHESPNGCDDDTESQAQFLASQISCELDR